MSSFFRRQEHKYAPLAAGQDEEASAVGRVEARSENIWTRKHIGLLMMLGALAAVAGVFAIGYVHLGAIHTKGVVTDVEL